MSRLTIGCAVAVLLCATVAEAQYTYKVDDGTAEDAFGFNAGPGDPAKFDVIYLNRFTVQPNADVVTAVQIAFGAPVGGASHYEGRPINVLLYDNASGGVLASQLRQSVPGTIQMADTNTLVTYAIPPTPVKNAFVVGFVAHDAPLTPAGDSFYGAQNFTAPTYPGVSFVGAQTNTPINEKDLSSITGPNALFGPIESFPNQKSNFLIRAVGVPNGDANLDGSVGFDDLLVLAQHYGNAGSFADGDFTGDGTVGFSDLLVLAQNYGQSASGTGPAVMAVPEPSVVAVAVLLEAMSVLRVRIN